MRSRVGLAPELTKLFDQFWEAYPSRGGHTNPKRKAAMEFARAVAADVDHTEIISGAQAYADWCRVRGIERTWYVREAHNWLKDDGWEGDYAIGWHLLNDVKDQADREAMEVRLEDWDRRRG